MDPLAHTRIGKKWLRMGIMPVEPEADGITAFRNKKIAGVARLRLRIMGD
jgi:hypothetical protein